MGVYLNPGSDKYQIALNSEIYVDKTGMIKYINSIVSTEQRYVSVSRPRRFGKSMTANMLCAYYGKGNSRTLFEKSKLARYVNWDRYLNSFDVIKIVMTDFIKSKTDISKSLDTLTKRILYDLSEAYPNVNYDEDDLIYSLDRFYRANNMPFVIIIDEWDAIFRERKFDKEGQMLYLDFLRDWLKDKGYVALAYITGILPIKKYGKHSALNMFDEYSIISPMQLAPYTGFTDEEVKKLCEDYGRIYGSIKEWYDGYKVSDIIPPDPGYKQLKLTGKENTANTYSLYCPLSVVNAVRNGIIQDYWNKTENYEALAEYIRMNIDGLKDSVALLMDGGRIPLNISTYQNDMTSFHGKDDVLTMLIHLGYLGYDADTEEAYIPNNEILDEFKASTKSEEWIGIFASFKKSQELLYATWEQNEDKVASLLEWFHDTTENKTYNSEAALSYALQMAYYASQKYYTVIQELDSGKGYVGLAFIPSPKYSDKPALLVELKINKTAKTAANQIRSRNYPQKLEHYMGNLLLVSVNYDKDMKNTDALFKHHSCKIEKA